MTLPTHQAKIVALALFLLPLAAFRANAASGADGLWRSEGYGYLLEVRGDRFELFETTSVSCLSSLQGEVRNRSLVIESFGSASFEADPVGGTRRLQMPGTASALVFHPVGTKPAACSSAPANTPVANFDVYWTTYAEQYPFFRLKGIDWQAVRERFRPQVTESTTPAELFAIFRDMIAPLSDAHTSVSAPDLQLRYSGFRETDSSPLSKAFRTDEARARRDLLVARTQEIIDTQYLEGAPQRYCNGHLRFGRIAGGIGYLMIDGFSGYAEGDYAASEKALDEALDAILGQGPPLSGLVIDVRWNNGGADPLGLLIASRLTDREYLAFTKEAVLATTPEVHWTAGQPSRVVPSGRPRFLGPVAELIGPRSVSAAETFTMALMGRQPAVRRFGEPTQGVFSDVLGRKLPNGFRFGLANEQFLTADGRSFDGPGIPPDVPVPVFPQSDLDAGRDGALAAAIAWLRAPAPR